MKGSKVARLIITLVIVLMSMAACQHKTIPAADETNPTVQDYRELFELELYSDKSSYKTSDQIRIWATLKYVGKDSQVRIWHGIPYINFYISDGKDFNTGGIVATVMQSTILEKGKLYRFEYEKNGGYSGNDPNASFWKKFYEEKDLYLPEGEYTIKVSGGFSLSQNMKEGNNNLSKEIKISVSK